MVAFAGRINAPAALMPFAVGTHVAYNVLRFPTPREPTVRAAKGCPPPFMEADYPARGGQRPQAATRKKRVICRWVRAHDSAIRHPWRLQNLVYCYLPNSSAGRYASPV